MSLLDPPDLVWIDLHRRVDGGGRRRRSGRSSPPRATSSAASAARRRPTSPRPPGAPRTIQRAWAATPFDERAAIMRKAGELSRSTPRRSTAGSSARPAASRPRRGWRPRSRRQECYEAAALASRAATASCSAATQPRLSLARRDARRRRRRHLAVQLPADPVHPLGRARAGARQRGRAQARPAHGGLPAASSWPGSSRRRGCPPACCTCCPAAPTSAEALVDRPDVRVISFTGSTAAGRRVGELAARHLKRVHLELGGNSALVVLDDADLDRAVVGRRFGLVPAPGPDLHDHRPPPRARGGRRRLRRARWPSTPTTCRSATRPPARSRSARSSTRGSATSSTGWSPPASTPAPGWPPAARTTDLFYRPTVLAEVRRARRRTPRRSSARSRRSSRFVRWTRRRRWPRRPTTGCRSGILTRDVMKGAGAGRPDPDRASSTSTTRPSTTRRSRRSAACGDSGTGARLGGAGNLEAFTERPVDHPPRRHPAVPVLAR